MFVVIMLVSFPTHFCDLNNLIKFSIFFLFFQVYIIFSSKISKYVCYGIAKIFPKKEYNIITTKEFNEFPILRFNVNFNQWR
jgi:hypothetical protein